MSALCGENRGLPSHKRVTLKHVVMRMYTMKPGYAKRHRIASRNHRPITARFAALIASCVDNRNQRLRCVADGGMHPDE